MTHDHRTTADDIDPIIAQLRQARREAGLSQQQLGKQLGRHTYQTVGQWERGINEPKLSNLREWAAALGLDVMLGARATTTAPSTPNPRT